MYKSIENGFCKLTSVIYNHRYIALISIILVTIGLLSQIFRLTIDMRDENFFHDDDPILTEYNAFRDSFGQDDVFIIAMTPKNGLTPSFLQTLIHIHKDLEASVPYVDEITSLVNGRIVRGEGDTIRVENLMENAPATEEEFKTLLKTIERYPLYENILISEDKSIVSIVLRAQAVIKSSDENALAGFTENIETTSTASPTYLSNKENIEIYEAIKAVTNKYKDKDIAFHYVGTPVFVAEISKGIEKDLRVMMPLSFLMIILFLFLFFRRLPGVFFPLIVVTLSLLSSLGIMAIMEIPITIVTQILPAFLIVVGIGDSVHILSIFYQSYQGTDNKHDAIVSAVGFAGLPILMTSLTTALGLSSFIFADVKSIAQLGYVAPIGVILAFFYTIILLPALIAIFPIKPESSVATAKTFLLDIIFTLIARFTTRRPSYIIVISLVFICLAGYFSLNLRFSHNALTWFPKDTPLRASSELMDKAYGGTVMLEVTVDSGEKNGLYDPNLMQRFDDAAKDIHAISVHNITSGKVWSIADVLKETNRALFGDAEAAYLIPRKRDLIAQEMMLFESSGSDDMKDFADSTFQVGRISILAPFSDSVLYKDYVDKIVDYLKTKFPREKVILTGHIALFIQITKHFITSMAKSYGFALIAITFLMILMVGRFQIGLLSVIANIVPILLVFGLMGMLDISLDMSTILIGIIILGLIVDDTIHFLHHFRLAYEETHNVEDAVHKTLFTTGRALAITSMVLCAGFFIYTTSFLLVNIRFGLLVGCAIIFALAADFFLIPAILSIIYRKVNA